MRMLTIILTCSLVAWLIMIVRDRIKGVRKLKEQFNSKKLDEELNNYQMLIENLDERIQKLSLSLEDNIQLETSRKQRRKNKIETEIVKLSQKRNGIDKVRHELELVINDLKNHYGEIPTAEMQKHLSDFLNDRDRLK